jgi:hypothetical protein
MTPIKQAGFGLVLSLGLGLAAAAQNQAPSNSQAPATSGSSLGDYARQVRKDSGQPKAKPKVFDNDNLPKDDKLSVVGAPVASATDTGVEAKPAEGPTEAKAAEGAAAGAPVTEAKPPATTKTSDQEAVERQAAWKQWVQRLSEQKNQIDLLQRELDVLQREYQIRAAAFYADAGNRMRNSASWDKQDADYKQQIADKQKAVDDAKQKLDDLEEEARKAGVPASMRD